MRLVDETPEVPGVIDGLSMDAPLQLAAVAFIHIAPTLTNGHVKPLSRVVYVFSMLIISSRLLARIAPAPIKLLFKKQVSAIVSVLPSAILIAKPFA